MGGGIGNGDIAASYSRRYAQAATRLLGTEGGFVDDPADHGGATKDGVSLRFLLAQEKIDPSIARDFDLDMDGDIDVADIRNITMSEAVALYYRCFWEPLACDSFPEPIGEMLFDQGVNGGFAAARKLLQRAINSCLAHMSGTPFLSVDGAVGPASRTAMEAVIEHPGLGMPALAEAYREAARARYRAIAIADPRQARFLNGWLRRADELGAEA